MKAESRSDLYLVDGSGYLFRAYHAITHLSNSKGQPTNAIYGVTRMLLKLLDDEQPERVAVIMDPPGKNFRHEIYPAYKANRPPAPEDLKAQIPLVYRAIEVLALPLLVPAGFEADDLIASLTDRARAAGLGVTIVSADKDLLQLVGEGVEMWDPMRDLRYNPAAVREKWGVAPGQVADLLALMGDSSDNVPGIAGVGPKTAAKLLGEHGDLPSVLSAAPGMKKSKLRERLIEQADSARLSRRLVELKRDVEPGLDLDGLVRGQLDAEALDAFLVEMEFTGLRRELVGKRTIDTSHYQTVRTELDLEAILEEIHRSGAWALDLETTSLDPLQAQIVGFSLSPSEGSKVPP